MSYNYKEIRKILFVDDDPSYLDMVEKVLSVWSKSSWTFLKALNTAKAIEVLEGQLVDLIVLDLMMPGVDGLQFLRLLHRRYPGIPKVVLTGSQNEVMKTACMSNGADLYLEKPHSIEAMESVYSALNELSQLVALDGFRGIVRRVRLFDLLQLECQSANSAVLEVTSGSVRGLIYYEQGVMVHAEAPERKGLEALNYLLALPGGEFNCRPFTEPAERSLDGSWETQFFKREGKEAPLPGAKSEAETEAAGGVQADEEGAEEELAMEPWEMAAPRVAEMLVASERGEVLLARKCPEAAGRLGFLEEVGRQAEALGQLLPLGAYDRLMAQGPSSRVTLLHGPDRRVLVRLQQGIRN